MRRTMMVVLLCRRNRYIRTVWKGAHDVDLVARDGHHLVVDTRSYKGEGGMTCWVNGAASCVCTRPHIDEGTEISQHLHKETRVLSPCPQIEF